MGISTFDEATRPGGTGFVGPEHKHRCLKCGEYLNCIEGCNGGDALKGAVWEICDRHEPRRIADDFDWWWEQRRWYHP